VISTSAALQASGQAGELAQGVHDGQLLAVGQLGQHVGLELVVGLAVVVGQFDGADAVLLRR
jgi:hypothetical protein